MPFRAKGGHADLVSSITALQPHAPLPVDPGPFRGRIRFGCAEPRTVLVPQLPSGTQRQRDGKLAELAHAPCHTKDFANIPSR